MTDERDKSSRTAESVARPTARELPFLRGTESVSEPAPQGQRPGQLPRDPSYEAELAQVELAVLRESPGPPSSGGRAVASGTLLSVGTVDPRGKTERTLETPRLFFSEADAAGEAYFKPGAIPAVTVHQTLETETVKLSDSIDPRRAKTIPRLDRVALAQLAEAEPESAAPLVLSGPASTLEADPSSLPGSYDGGIHASLSPFREHVEPSFSYAGPPTRPEPLATRRPSGAPEAPPSTVPDPSAIPTQRDLPAHRIEASQPPPARVAAPGESGAGPDSEARGSDLPLPTTASIAGEQPERRPAWVNYLAFVAALLFAVAVGLFLTRQPESPPAPAARVPAPVVAAPIAEPEPPAAAPAPVVPAAPPAAAEAAPKKSPAPPVAPAPAPASKPTPSKSNRETIF